MPYPREQVKAIFGRALDLDSAEKRTEYLDEVCGDQSALRAEVEDLLAAIEKAGNFLGSGSPQVGETIDHPVLEKPGTIIGPYKLLQKLGEGGMGVVYMAEQSAPVKRRVALKIIKPGMDTGQVIARFEAERQALALMDHPGIAKVIDAGATESGRPYFAMELVNGVSITLYCDEQHFTPKQRLELFIQVCQAVQHAHQKGIIHRDLKPSNVLVAEYDHKAVPKIIDFGVAKATSQQLTEKTMFTQYGQIVGTLEYMSPEQAKLNQLDIDTRSDIYSLGVLLYELLVGTTPFDRTRLRSAAFEEMLRIIREEEPPKPSIRLSTIDALRAVAAHRKTDPRKLSTLVRGELDWIVMRALDKDRGRRYETANGFADDIQRYLNDEAVVACPPSAAYRFRKFARRNRGFVIAASTVTAALLIGFAAALTGLVFAEAARRDAEQQRAASVREAKKAQLMSSTLTELLSTTFPTVERGPDFTVRDMLDEFTIDDALSGYPEIEGDVRYILGFAYRRLQLYKQAESHLRRAFQVRREVFGNEHEKVAECLRTLSRVTQDITQAREALRIQRRLGKQDESLCKTLTWMGWHLLMREQYSEAEQYGREALEILAGLPNQANSLVKAQAQSGLASSLSGQGKYAEAIFHFEAALLIHRQLPHTFPAAGYANLGLAQCYWAQGDHDHADHCLREALDVFEKCGRPSSQAAVLWQIATIQESQGHFREAEEFVAVVEEKYRKLDRDTEIAWTVFSLAAIRFTQGDWSVLQSKYPEIVRWQTDDMYLTRGRATMGVARMLQAQGKTLEADEHFRGVIETYKDYEENGNDIELTFKEQTALELYLLATLYLSSTLQDDVDKAIQLVERVVEKHGVGVIPASTLAQLYARGNYLDQAQHFLASIEVKRAHHLSPSLFIIGYRNAERAVIKALREKNLLDRAEAVYREGLEKRRREWPKNHADIAFAKQGLASLLIEQQRYGEAEPYVLQAYELLKDHPIAPESRKETARDQIIKLYEAWEKPEELSKWRDTATVD